MKKTGFILILTVCCFILSFTASALYEDGEGIYSECVYMENLETGRIIFDTLCDDKVYPASLTKILTCLVAIEKCEDLNETFEIPSGIFDDVYAQGGAHISLKYGEVVTVSDLLHATMIRSACDSATALAYYVSGSVEAFAEEMNKKAAEIGASNTHFVNAHGLHDDNHYTTPRDLAIITKYALQNEKFCDIISKWCYTVPATNMSDERYFESTIEIEIPENPNYYDKVTGVKSGFTDEAGRCLITLSKDDGESYLLVTLGANKDGYYNSNMAFTDAVNLHEYCHARFSIDNIIEKDSAVTSVKVENGTVATVDLTTQSSQEYLCAVDETKSVTYSLPESVKAPVKAGDEIGTVTVTVGEHTVTEKLYAAQDVKAVNNSAIVTDSTFVNVLNILSIIIYAVSGIVLIVFCILFFKGKKKAKK